MTSFSIISIIFYLKERLISFGLTLLLRRPSLLPKSKRGKAIVDGNTFLFIPSALYAYWVSRYLFEKKANQILLPEQDA